MRTITSSSDPPPHTEDDAMSSKDPLAEGRGAGVALVAATQHTAVASTTHESRLAALSGRIHYAALLLVVASCPFEAGYRPVGRFLWAIFTNLEAALFILGAAWLVKLAVDPAARSRLLKLPLLLPICALLAASVVSSIFGEYTSLGVQFIYRLLVGVMVYASAYEALRDKKRLLAALATFVAAGTISAALGLLEFAPAVDIQPWLKPFKPQPTTVGGMVRLSGTFEYANGAAMYFEMAIPVLLGLVTIFKSKRLVSMLYSEQRPTERTRLGVVAVLLIAALLYTPALILTFSRAALVGLAIALAVFGALAVARRRAEARRAGDATPGREGNSAGLHDLTIMTNTVMASLGIFLVVAVASTLLVFFTQPMFRLRLTTENDRDWYGASVSSAPLPTLAAGQVISVPITVTNYGLMTWSSAGVLPVHISYHWLSPTQNLYLVFDGLRTALPHDVSPGETLSVNAIVQAPPQPGDYRLQWDFVHENVTWFEGKLGMKSDLRAYHVGPAVGDYSMQTPQSAMPPPVTLESNTDFASVGRGQLWKVAVDMFLSRPIAGVGPDGFRNLYGKYAGVDQWNRNIYTNNTYLEMFTDLGLLGGLAFLWLAGLAVWRAVRNVLRETISPSWVLGLGASAALIAFFGHGVVDYFLFATPIYVAFWFTMSIAVNWQAGQNNPGQERAA